jgi:hypothetical protein
MTDETFCACAHLHVEYDPVDNGDGTLSERWACRECKTEFVPKFPALTQQTFDQICNAMIGEDRLRVMKLLEEGS